jgi:hypothetical protein
VCAECPHSQYQACESGEDQNSDLEDDSELRVEKAWDRLLWAGLATFVIMALLVVMMVSIKAADSSEEDVFCKTNNQLFTVPSLYSWESIVSDCGINNRLLVVNFANLRSACDSVFFGLGFMSDPLGGRLPITGLG